MTIVEPSLRTVSLPIVDDLETRQEAARIARACEAHLADLIAAGFPLGHGELAVPPGDTPPRFVFALLVPSPGSPAALCAEA